MKSMEGAESDLLTTDFLLRTLGLVCPLSLSSLSPETRRIKNQRKSDNRILTLRTKVLYYYNCECIQVNQRFRGKESEIERNGNESK